MSIGTASLPSTVELERLDEAAFQGALRPLFEGAPRFIARLVAARPYASWSQLLDRAASIALEMPVDEQLELIDSHPRIGASPGSVSALSFVEQGYDGSTADEHAEAGREHVAAELERLNAAYEARFGFRFVIFVAGRPRAAIVPLMEERLTADRDAEIVRALRDVVSIARARVRRLRGQEEGS